MHEIQNLHDDQLLKKMKELVMRERETTVQVLHHLKEVERRRLFARLGFPSLFEYCVRELGYSEASAQRRIASMRLLKELPEVEEKIAEGKLNLSTVSQAQSFFRKESYSIEQKRALLGALENMSRREVERELISRSSAPQRVLPDKIRPITETHSELRVTLSEAALVELEKIRGLLAHSHPNMSLAEVIEYMAKLTLAKLDPAREPAKKPALPPAKPTETVRRRAIPAAIRRIVWRRDEGRCRYVDPKTGRKCRSSYALQIDHIRPFAAGGSHEPENLRLLCANHNQHAADRSFGRDWMGTKRTQR